MSEVYVFSFLFLKYLESGIFMSSEVEERRKQEADILSGPCLDDVDKICRIEIEKEMF